MAITLEIDAIYAPLLKQQPQFWKKPPSTARSGLDGVQVKMGNLATPAWCHQFDKLGTGRSSHQLFDSKEQASSQVRTLTLTADHKPGLRVGSPIRYRGVDIGKVEQVELDPTLGQVSFKARAE